ncbi:hypothetical protein [uncultured Methanobacterium sp.]|uniref:hypothetical protein n=1 Tax=uncultured Methanobacterium sp. TaxID=176306 RepID=UPI002AA806DF|nr:hypothetical protein [uncultured Methanobacterium sp.]
MEKFIFFYYSGSGSHIWLYHQTDGNNTTCYKTFDKDGISLQYPGNWSEKAIPPMMRTSHLNLVLKC